MNLDNKSIEEIKYISRQGPYKINRVRLICNLYQLEKEELYKLLRTPT